jgi:hypothetical protein
MSESTEQESSPTFRHDSTHFERFPDIYLEAGVEAFLDLITKFE